MTTSDFTALTGGVSCDVKLVREGDREIVVKEPLAKLKVTDDWRSNVDRFAVEVAGLRALRELLGERHAPKVLWVDDVNRRFAMERIDARFRNWKQELLSGRVNFVTAASVGELLGQMHTRSSASKDLARAFQSQIYFEELRVEPFFERVAARNRPLAGYIDAAIADLRAPGQAFVHGDFSPKNLLVDGAEVVILDLEIAHWGNPRFDVAFCLSHLLLKGLRHGADPDKYAGAARVFSESYRKTGMPVWDSQLVRILGSLLLARFDGASPVDYRAELDETRARLLAAACLRGELPTLEAAISAI